MGSDKGLLIYNNKFFIESIIEVLSPFVKEIIIVSDHTGHDVFNLKRVPDIIKNSGPLAGIYSGLYHSKTEHNIILSCDIPLIHSEIIEILSNSNSDRFDIIQIKSRGKTMPLIALYKKHCLDRCLSLLQQGERRLRIALNEFKVKTIDLKEDLYPFTKNINTPTHLKEIENEINH